MQKEVRSWNKTWNKKNSNKEKCIVAKSLKFYLFALFPLKNFWSHFLTNLVVIKEGTAVMLGLRGLSLTSDDSWLHLRRHLLAFSCCRSFAFLDCLHINFYRAQFQIYHKIVLDRLQFLAFLRRLEVGYHPLRFPSLAVLSSFMRHSSTSKTTRVTYHGNQSHC